ncbi:MAG TPA: hypothetical protein PLL30_01965 [Candidatus Krumholzibacteria bacterium]|nr:hypothetical protein [Candidatus Krumholzibacteria bacterium]HPD70532.1 hypothetical protein [Candidatus Krumholzibacteria bacterium]HRY39768.1 hypothetical protein [Candidatus Krumholzibacteria bacterium]
MNADAVHPWDLWVLHAIDPLAGPDQVRELREARARHYVRERAIVARLLAGDRTPLAGGHRMLTDAPELRQGLVLTLHLGPYQLVLEPFLAAGLVLTLLVNAAAERHLRATSEDLRARLGLPGELRWVVAEAPDAGRQLLRALRGDGPVLAFADGNQGRGGLAETRRRGIPYRLPGREIRVRTGLARLICRTECPVHPVAVRWDEDGRSVAWRRQPTQRWTRRDDPDEVTRLLFDWVFHEIRQTPNEWSYWQMLVETAACFATEPAGGDAAGLRDHDRRAFETCLARAAKTVRVELDAEVAVWPGGILVDSTDDRFFDAAGLRDQDLEPLRAGRPTLAELTDDHGREWVERHVLRLCLLGLARLSGETARAAV